MKVPVEELAWRMERVRRGMRREGIDAMLVVQNADLFYLTGTVQQGALWVPREGEPLFLVRKDLGRAREESPLTRVEPLRSPRELGEAVLRAGLPWPVARAGMEWDVLPVLLARRWETALEGAEAVDGSPVIREARQCKSPWEVARMEEAAKVAEEVFATVPDHLRVGIAEVALAAEVEREARRRGHQGVVRMRAFNAEMFYGHVFAGPDSAVPGGFDTPLGGRGLSPAVAQGAGYRPIQEGDPVVVDLVICLEGYLVDQTRTFCPGTPSSRLRELHDATRAIEDAVIRLARPGTPWGVLHEAAMTEAERLGLGGCFMGPPGAQVAFVGHGVGIEVDERPFLARGFAKDLLEPGMTFALEPKVVLPDLGAVGTEDTWLVEESGVRRLTRGSRDLQVVAG